MARSAQGRNWKRGEMDISPNLMKCGQLVLQTRLPMANKRKEMEEKKLIESVTVIVATWAMTRRWCDGDATVMGRWCDGDAVVTAPYHAGRFYQRVSCAAPRSSAYNKHQRSMLVQRDKGWMKAFPDTSSTNNKTMSVPSHSFPLVINNLTESQ